MCQVGTCVAEAEFLVKHDYQRVQAVCEKHLKEMAVHA
jgi:hypothetical protein